MANTSIAFEEFSQQDSSMHGFMSAVVNQDYHQVEEYLRTGLVSVNAIDVSHRSALIYAAKDGSISVIQKLLEYGADVHYRDPGNGCTALHYAAQSGHTQTVKLLVENGRADKRVKDKQGRTPFDLAINSGHGGNTKMRQYLAGSPTTLDVNNNLEAWNDSLKTSPAPSVTSISTVIGDDGADGEIARSKKRTNLSERLSLRRSFSSVDVVQASIPRAETIPSRALLDILTKTGVYFPLELSNGFTLLHTHASAAPLEEIAHNLDLVNPTIMQLLAPLQTLYHRFDREDSLLANVDVPGALSLVRNRMANNVPRRRQSRTNQRQQHQYEEEIARANTVVYYINWKKQNQSAVEQIIKQLQMRLANVADRCEYRRNTFMHPQ